MNEKVGVLWVDYSRPLVELVGPVELLLVAQHLSPQRVGLHALREPVHGSLELSHNLGNLDTQGIGLDGALL